MTPGAPLASPAPSRRSPQGVALVIVLAFLALLSVLIFAFFNSVQTELQGSKSYADSTSVKQLVNSATDLVIGQITDGTRSSKIAAGPGDAASVGSGTALTWASQPGMIRTWDDSGTPWKAFKLYSAQDMVVDTAKGYSTANQLATEVPPDWYNQRSLFTDLNAPVLIDDQNGTIKSLTKGGSNSSAVYPILDPLAQKKSSSSSDDTTGVDGFSVTSPPGYSGTNPPDPGYNPTTNAQANPAPMPVRWIYVLKDGALTSPTGAKDNGLTATWDKASGAVPSKTNPIVGRVAFWTDDETSKINVNTASEPTPWDTPRAFCKADLDLGQYQPASKEYQRYPGHPLTVALSPVLAPGFLSLPTAQQGLIREDIYNVIPRVVGGAGSTMSATVVGSKVLTPDQDRLFANVDEFLFSPNLAGSSRVENDAAKKSTVNFSPALLKKSRFFLTANSRAPEVNAYGKPRISMWPVSSDPNKRTTFDQLALFCTTLGGPTSTNLYTFERNDPRSSTADYENIARNKQLYAYLQALTATDVPGFGKNFLGKMKDDRDQLLTEIFDYIRCTNLKDTQFDRTDKRCYTYDAELQKGENTPASVASGQVTPIVIGATKGFGRFHTISQFGFHFICNQQGDQGVLTAAKSPIKLAANERLVSAAFLFEPYSPSLGFYKLSEDMSFSVNFNGAFSINGQPLNMRSGMKPLNDAIGTGFHNDGREHGGSGGVRGPVVGLGGGNYQFVSMPNTIAAAPTAVKVTGNTMQFVGGSITVVVYAGASSSVPVQTFNINFPDGTFPMPDLVNLGTTAYRIGGTTSNTSDWWTFAGRYAKADAQPQAPGIEYADPTRRWAPIVGGGQPGFKAGSLFRREDVVRTMVPNHGDIRLIAAQKTLNIDANNPNSPFVKVRAAEWDSNYRFLHIFHNNSGPHFMYGFCNEPGAASPSTDPMDIPASAPTDQLTASSKVIYHYSRLPEIRPGAGKQFNKYGDFDNGPAQWVDGSYINKPDEGNQSATSKGIHYWSWNDYTEVSSVFFSPNRIIPSPGMLGSLSTGVKRNLPWQTLLFRPPPVSSATPHPGADAPRDHLMMDLFWMPVCEPYAISEPFSTAGKINMNFEIAPFSYIRRATAMQAALRSEAPMIIPNVASKVYKLWDHETNDVSIMPDDNRDQDPDVHTKWAQANNGQAPFDKMRSLLDADETLKQFDGSTDGLFGKGDIFRSATQICDLHLVRKGEQLTDYQNDKIWPNNLLTGDNTRERPYTNLYGKLTTKSNSYTVHIRAQVLRKTDSGNAADWATWRETRDATISEFRGSSLIERYVDPSDPTLVDFALPANAGAALDTAYKFRVISTKKFTP